MKQKIPLPMAQWDAHVMKEVLEPFCERVEIAGSVRRREKFCGDLEIVAIPKMEPVASLFPGVDLGQVPILDRLDWSGYGALKMNGPRQKKIILRGDVQLDLFLATPHNWGYIFMLRTGADTFSRKMVTRRLEGGYMPSYLTAKDGEIWAHGIALDIPEETALFDLYQMAYIEPWERR